MAPIEVNSMNESTECRMLTVLAFMNCIAGSQGPATSSNLLPCSSESQVLNQARIALQVVEKVVTGWTGLPCPPLKSFGGPAFFSQTQVIPTLMDTIPGIFD